MNLIEFIFESNRSQTVEDLNSIWSRFISEFGVGRTVSGDQSQKAASETRGEHGQQRAYPHDWFESHYAEHGPVILDAIRTNDPFSLAEILNENVSRKVARRMNEANENRLKSRISLADHLPQNKIAGFGTSGTENDPQWDNDTLSILHAASHQFVMIYSELIKADPLNNEDIHLTSRESEVLSWVAEGKTKMEIGDILSVSESTIKRHCEHLLKKFRTKNLTSTVAKAIRMGLI